MRLRSILALATVAAATASVTPATAAAQSCTWGGTALAPTGTTTQHPGITNDPAPARMSFRAVGELGGDCHGRFAFAGHMDAGSTCAFVTFSGRAIGIPGVARFEGYSVAGFAPARLLDSSGNVVGSENAQFLTGSQISDCTTAAGMTHNHFSSVIELFGSRRTASNTRVASSTHTLDGACRLSGALVFDEPIGTAPRPTGFTDTATGTCSGTLDGVPIDNLPTRNDVHGLGVISCAGGHALSSDVLDFGHGTTIHIASDSFAVPAGGVSHFSGWSSGDGVVAVEFDPPDQSMLARCQEGTLRKASYHLTARTFGPVTG
jgi:hypothetical protein